MIVPTNSDLLVVMIVGFIACLFVIGAVVYIAWDIHKGVKEGQRMTRAVAGLVVQESEKIRALMRD